MIKYFDFIFKFVPLGRVSDSSTTSKENKRMLKEKYIRWIKQKFSHFNEILKYEKRLFQTSYHAHISHWIPYLCDQTCVSDSEQLCHTWSPTSKSVNIRILKSNPFKFHRNPVANSTDSIRGKIGYSSGIHIWRIQWPRTSRGTHAVIGVSTDKSLLQYDSYIPLVGFDNESWGWDIVNLRKVHGLQFENPICQERYPDPFRSNVKLKEIPERIYVVLDMDQGTLSFMTSTIYLGVAHRGLKGKTLYPSVSSVWGHSEVTLTYFNHVSNEPPSLKNLCTYEARRLLKYHCLFNEQHSRSLSNKNVSGIDTSEDYKKVVLNRNIPKVLKQRLLTVSPLNVNFDTVQR